MSQSGSSLAEQHAALLSAENVDSTPELLPATYDHKSAHPAAQFGGFLKLDWRGGCISEAKMMLPNDVGENRKRREREPITVSFTRETPIVLSQLLAFTKILQQASSANNFLDRRRIRRAGA